MAALVQAGIEPTDFDHIIFASSGSFCWYGVCSREDVRRAYYCWLLSRTWPVWNHPFSYHGGFYCAKCDEFNWLCRCPTSFCEKNNMIFSKKVTHVLEKAVGKNRKYSSGRRSPFSCPHGQRTKNPQEWYETPVLPPDYHTARPDGKKNPVIHVVTTTTGEHPQSRYIRSDTASPEEFQKALAATLTIPRWSEPIRKVGRKSWLMVISQIQSCMIMLARWEDPTLWSSEIIMGTSRTREQWKSCLILAR